MGIFNIGGTLITRLKIVYYENGEYMHTKYSVFILSILLVFQGCVGANSYTSTKNVKKPLIGEFEKRVFAYDGIERNPVIVIHGLFGSTLVDNESGAVVWGEFSGVDTINVAALRRVALPMQKEKPLNELNDHIYASGILEKVNLRFLGLPIEVDAYQDMVAALVAGGYYAEGFDNIYDKEYFTCFQFAYDWRRDIVENATRLKQFIDMKRQYLQRHYERVYGVADHPIQFDIVAHSMGGLVARYFLRYGAVDLPEDGSLPRVTWKGSEDVDKVIILGTPNAGYVDTLVELVEGLSFITGMPKMEAAVLGTFPSVYQMLPSMNVVVSKKDTNRVLDVFEPQLWEKMNWGLARGDQDHVLASLMPEVDTKEERQKIAKEHLRKSLIRARQFTKAMATDEGDPPHDVSLHLFVGEALPTNTMVIVNEENGKIAIAKEEPGDGKVPVISALYDRRYRGAWKPFLDSPIHWDSVTYLFAAHMGITNDPSFVVNMLHILLQKKSYDHE